MHVSIKSSEGSKRWLEKRKVMKEDKTQSYARILHTGLESKVSFSTKEVPWTRYFKGWAISRSTSKVAFAWHRSV